MTHASLGSIPSRQRSMSTGEPDGRRVRLNTPLNEYKSGIGRASIRVSNGAPGTVIATSAAREEVTVVFDDLPWVMVILPERWVEDA